MAVSRKAFLRILGGGIVVAAGAAIAVPRLDAMPAVAVEGWRGPGPDETDPRRRALAWALLAPNPHNLQSWAVDLSQPGAIVLHVDAARLLSQTDPFSRQILIGHGCFLEILGLAAAADGYRTEVTLFPEGAWSLDRPVARVVFTRQSGLAVDPLFAEVPRRRTVKGGFDARPLEAAHKALLLSGYAAAQLPLVLVDDAESVDRLRALAIAGSEMEMNTPRTHKESIDVVRIGAAEIAAHRDGISLKGPMIWALRQAGQMTPAKAMTPGTLAWDGGRDYALAGYTSARAFGWITSADNARPTQIATGRAFVRLQLAATALGVALQPHSQTLQEYPEMAALRTAMHRQTGTPAGATLQMFFRLGYAADPGPSPRRALNSFVTA
ncbi:MAG: twin-arginine translocation pathway signal protein [Reyranella sp.]|nr:twin-arginine translocation pathway signal protein [Reyranella sp.]MDP3161022.1 twin-arginine translocation pathway signal protein [Reyranella sp.]